MNDIASVLALIPDALLIGVLKSELRETDALPTSMGGDSIGAGSKLAAVDETKTVEVIGDGVIVVTETACPSEEEPGDVSP